MLFGKRPRKINRLLIVEDEPLIAFDNEYFLQTAGFNVVATVDNVAQALAAIEEHEIDLILSDVSLSDGGDGRDGRDVAHAAQAGNVPLVFVTGSCPVDAQALAIGCLAKPYSQRDLLAAIEAVEARLAGKKAKKLPPSFTLFN